MGAGCILEDAGRADGVWQWLHSNFLATTRPHMSPATWRGTQFSSTLAIGPSLHNLNDMAAFQIVHLGFLHLSLDEPSQS